MISTIKRVSRTVVQRGALLQNQSALSTIVLPDLTFDYGALEPVVQCMLCLIANRSSISHKNNA